MAVMVATNLLAITESKKIILFDAPVSTSGLFGTAVEKVVEKFRKGQECSQPP